MNEPSTIILEQCKNSFKQIRVNLIEATEALYRIKSEELWKGEYGSFGVFVELELQISQSFASKLLSNWELYVVKGGLQKEQIQGVDYEKLYLAQKVEGDALTKMTFAKTLSRSEIKAELAEKNGEPCEHPSKVEICTICHQRV